MGAPGEQSPGATRRSESLGGNERARYRTAAGSAAEVGAALDVAVAWGYIAQPTTQPAREALDRIRAML